MPVLLNPRHERFCQELAKAVTLEKAHKNAGFSGNRGNAFTLSNKAYIQLRLAEIIKQKNEVERKALARVTRRLEISKTRIIEEFAWVAFATAESYIDLQDGRASWKKWGDLSPPLMAAVDGVKVNEKTGAVTYRLPSLPTKLEALGKIGIELGMFVTRTDNKHSSEKRFSQLPPEERRAYAADLLARAREAIERQRVIEAQAQDVGESPG